jgi:hypothetical protein
MLRLPLLVSAVVSVLAYVHAQSNDSVNFFIPSKVRTADFATCSYSWRGEVTHNVCLLALRVNALPNLLTILHSLRTSHLN